MSVVVSDTSPIRCLAQLHLLDILPRLFSEVLIPPAVAEELRRPASGPASLDLQAVSFLQVRAPADAGLVQRLMARLHLGESEALVLALEVKPDVVLIDEKTGRALAKELGLAPLGVLGTLVHAKRDGLVGAVGPLMARLERELSFRISAEVKRRILDLAGE